MTISFFNPALIIQQWYKERNFIAVTSRRSHQPLGSFIFTS